ncbi:translocon-associated protein subunit beta [Phtheirospermum japonicum]|uniref:Translocon-associated protein subunit beta n=1 Tax=Phtheirospermum japonicum TaxID=374723 RepID=A0A830CLU1_9LAMI|nr:translocon-associated protein subunit beta [Phtheirospermum japonicum]
MANWSSGHVIFTLAALLLVSSTIASSEGPFIVAHKKASLTRLKSGNERVSVSIDVYNQGSATAYDVTVNDDSWSQDIFDIVTGNTSTSWERLDAGALLSHTFELEAKTRTVVYSAPALITFRIPTKAALQEAYSTPILPLDVLADRFSEKKLDLRILAKYGSLTSVISFVVLFVYLVATPSKPGAAKGSKKKR